MGNFYIKKGIEGQYYFHLNAANAQTILQSEGYHQKQSCIEGIKSVKENCLLDSRFQRCNSINGQFYFVLLAQNRKVIGTSETYHSRLMMENGIQSVKTNAPKAAVHDISVSVF